MGYLIIALFLMQDDQTKIMFASKQVQTEGIISKVKKIVMKVVNVLLL